MFSFYSSEGMFTDPTQGCQIQFQWGDPKFQWPGHVPPSLLANTTLRTAAAIPETDRQQSDTNIHTHTKADLTREQELNVHIVHHVSITNDQQIYRAFYHSTPLHYLVHHPPSNILYWRYYSLPNIFYKAVLTQFIKTQRFNKNLVRHILIIAKCFSDWQRRLEVAGRGNRVNAAVQYNRNETCRHNTESMTVVYKDCEVQTGTSRFFLFLFIRWFPTWG